MNKLVSDEMVESALAVLSIETARKAGKAKADVVRHTERVKQTMAKLRRESEGKTAQEREDWARVQPEYRDAVELLIQAEGSHEFYRDQRAKAEAILGAWQTENANARAAARMQ